MKQNLRFGLVLGRLAIVLKMSKIKKLKYVFRAVFMSKTNKKIYFVFSVRTKKLHNIKMSKPKFLSCFKIL